MKKLKLIYILLIILYVLQFLMCSKDLPENTWLFQIDEHKITVGDFNREFDLYLQNLGLSQKELENAKKSTELKSNYLQMMKNRYLIYYKAIEEKFDQEKKIQQTLNLFKKQLIITEYLKKKFGSKIAIMESEIENYYNSHRQKYKNMDILSAKKSIEYELLQEKYDTETMSLVNNLVKETSIKDNPEALLYITN